MPGLQQSFIQGLTEVSTVQKDQLGAVRREGKKRYTYVKLQNTTATVAVAFGDPLAYSVAAAAIDEGNHTVVSDLTDAAAVPVFAGCALTAVAGVAGTAYYIWVQTKGPMATITPAIAGTIGQAFKLSTTDKTFAAIAAFTDTPIGTVAHVASKRIILWGNN